MGQAPSRRRVAALDCGSGAGRRTSLRGDGQDDGSAAGIDGPPPELDDLPTSAPGGASAGRNVRLDSDSVSYSDIDAHEPQDAPATPSIRMCMTVRNSVIEREFATEQLVDVEYGETSPDEGAALGALLDGDDGDGLLDRDDGADGVGARSRASSSKKRTGARGSLRLSVIKSTTAVPRKAASALDNRATKTLRRKNKRLWKFCVWNCRRITACVALGLCALGGIGALAWWGATRVAGGGDGDGDGDADGARLGGGGGGSAAPTGPEPVRAPPRGQPTRSPSSPPSSRGASTSSAPISRPSLSSSNPPSSTSSPVPSASSNASSIEPSVANSTSAPSLYPSSSPSSNASSGVPTLSDAPSAETPFMNSTSGASLYPSASPSGDALSAVPTFINASFAEASSVIPTGAAALYPSSAPSTDAPAVEPTSSNASSFEAPSANSTSAALLYPSPSPSSNASSIEPPLSNASSIEPDPSFPLTNSTKLVLPEAPSVVSTSDALFVPSFSVSGSTSSTIAPTSSTASSIEIPSANSTVVSSLYASSSSSINASSVEPSLSNATSIDLTLANSTGATLLSPSSSAPSNISYIQPPSVNSTTASLVTMKGQTQFIPPSVVLTHYESIQTISGTKEFEHAGASVTINPTGEFIAAGFKEANGPTVEKTGLVRVYRLSSDNVYTPFGLDSMFGRAMGDEFGSSVSISNDGRRVAVGARSSSLPGVRKNGEATVFEYSEASDSWVPLGTAIRGRQERDRLGFSVSISGDGERVAVGAPRGNAGTGSASIHAYDGLDWVSFGDVVGGGAGDRTGFSVSLSNDGDTLAVGAFRSSKGDLTHRGSVSVYTVDSSSSLVNRGQTLVGTAAGAQFGYSVSLSGDGRRLAVGSNGVDAKHTTRAGLCEAYELRGRNWARIGALVGNEENEEVGSHVSMSTTGGVVGCSRNALLDGDRKGAVAVLEENEAEWNVVDTVISSHADSASFGASVSLSRDGKMLVAGAPSYNSSAGIFELFAMFE